MSYLGRPADRVRVAQKETCAIEMITDMCTYGHRTGMCIYSHKLRATVVLAIYSHKLRATTDISDCSQR